MQFETPNAIALRRLSRPVRELDSLLDGTQCFASPVSVPGFDSWGSSAMAENVRIHNLGPVLVSPNGVIFVDGVALTDSYRSRNFSSAEIASLQNPPNDFGVILKSAINISSPAPGNYFHFLFDYASRMALARAIDAFRTHTFISLNLKPYQHRILSELQLPLDNVLLCGHSWIRIERLIVFEQLGFGSYFSPQVIERMRALRGAVRGSATPGHSKIFISRRQQRARQVLNMENLERMAVDLGYVVVQPETLSFAEQAKLFFGASVVVGASGAALSNLAFCTPGARVLELRPVIPSLAHSSFFWKNFAQQCELQHYALDMSSDPDGRALSHHRWTFVADEDAFERQLKALTS